MEKSDLMQYESVKYWLESLGDQRTKENCLQYFPKFLEWCNMNPDQIIKQRREDQKSDDVKTRRNWEHKVKQFYNELYDKAEAERRGTWNPYSYLKTVRSFFSHNGFPLIYGKKEIRAPYSVKKKIIPSNAEVRALYDMLETLRDKAVLLLLYQSGLSETDVEHMNIEDIGDLKNPPIYYETIRQKTKIRVQTCIGEDTVVAIDRYLRSRGYPKKGPLFLSQKGERLTVRFIRESIAPIGKKVINPKFQIKGLRDAFLDALSRAKIQQRIADRMAGHKVAGARAHYEISKYTILEAYKSAYEYLTINTFRQMKEDQHEAMISIVDVVAKLSRIMMSKEPKDEIQKWRAALEEATLKLEKMKEIMVERLERARKHS